MIPLERYAEICDNLCLIYKGPSVAALKEIVQMAPVIEARYPGIHVYVACREDLLSQIQYDKLVPVSRLREGKHDYAYMREVRRAQELVDWKK